MLSATTSDLHIASRIGDDIVLTGERVYIKKRSMPLTPMTTLSLRLDQILPPEDIRRYGLDAKVDFIREHKFRYTSLSFKLAIQMHASLPGTHPDHVDAPHYEKRMGAPSETERRKEDAKRKNEGGGGEGGEGEGDKGEGDEGSPA